MGHSRQLARATLVLALLLGLIAAAILPELTTVQAAPARAALDHVVISQFRTQGITLTDEFVEVFNATANSVSLAGWSLRRSSTCGTGTAPFYTFPDIPLAPGQYYLVANNTLVGSVDTDGIAPSPGILLASDGGIALLDSSNQIVDQVGMCVDTLYKEGTPLAQQTATTDWSYQRPPDASGGSCTDSNNNASDFQLLTVAQPHNSLSTLTPCGPAPAPAATIANTPPPLSTPSADEIVISEIRFIGADGSTDEFVELFNRSCFKTFDLSQLSLRYSNGSGGTSDLTGFNPATILPPAHFFLIAGPGYAATSQQSQPDLTYLGVDIPNDGGVALFEGTNIIDQVGLSSGSVYKEGTPLTALNATSDQSYERLASTQGAFADSNNNATDFEQQPSDPRNSTQVGTCGVFATPTSSLTPTVTPTRTPLGFHPRIVINEVGWAGTSNSHADQYIELRNASPQELDLTGWSLETYSGGVIANLRGTLAPGALYLLVHGTSDQATAAATSTPTISATTNPPDCLVLYRSDANIDQVFYTALSSTGQAIYLIDPNNRIEDTADRYGYAWPAGTWSPPTSMERSSLNGAYVSDTTLGAWFTFAGDTSTTPRDCNGNHVRGTPGQQNWATNITATPSPTPAPTKKPTLRAPTPFGHMVINEFLPRAGTDWNQDGSIDVFDEFIELKNLGPIAVNLQGWKIDVLAAGPATSYTLPAKTLQPGDRILYFGSQDRLLQPDSGATVRLWNSRGVLIDARSYGPVADADISHCRIPDGYYWQDACFPTPGNENSLTGTLPVAPPALALKPPPCLLADTVPQPFRDAECDPSGANIFNRAYWDDQAGDSLFLVPDQFYKWHTWVQ